MEKEIFHTDVLVIGGGTAGLYAAITLSREAECSVLVVEKADITRSGCLAAGVNAINAYITKGCTTRDYLDYVVKDAEGIVRHDLVLSAAELFNETTADLEKLGLVILKDENGDYATRGKRNIKINGENIKPILADAVRAAKQVKVLNHVNITELLTDEEPEKRVHGAVGFSITERKAYVIYAKAVLVATGGAAGLYRPNNPGFSRHKMWYPPFNTGAGYAMGILAGAEMTSFEMRFVALRCKDTIAPTGTIAQGIHAKQVNAKGEVYEDQYGLTTSERIYGTVCEKHNGNGPCYLKTSGISDAQSEDLLKAYLNMAPAQTLKWIESGKLPGEQDVEIEGTEPYIVGGHTGSGYWVDTGRRTTVQGLYAAGDVAGGCPQKYVTGALAEGKIAALSILQDVRLKEAGSGEVHFRGTGSEETNSEASGSREKIAEIEDFQVECQAKKREKAHEKIQEKLRLKAERIIGAYERILSSDQASYSVEELEEAMQKVMDEYAGGISNGYRFNEKQLRLADEKIDMLKGLSERVGAADMHELLFAYELKERLVVCKSLIAHLSARHETRWHIFNEHLDYPKKDDHYLGYLNSVWKDGRITVFLRELVKEENYEHTDQS